MLRKFGRGIAFARRYRLPPHVFGRRKVRLRLRYLYVESEDGIAAHLQRLDAGSLDLVRLVFGNPLVSLRRKIAQFVKFRAVSRGDKVPLGKQDAGVFRYAAVYQVHDLGLRRERCGDAGKRRAAWRDAFPDPRDRTKRLRKGLEVPGVGPP